MSGRLDAVEDEVQLSTHFFSEESQYQVSVFLKQLIFAAVATIRDRICEMLGAVQLHGHARIDAEKIDLETSETIERDGEIRAPDARLLAA